MPLISNVKPAGHHTMSSPTVREVFLELREQCIWLQTCFNTYTTLYESDNETSGVLHKAAPAFFQELNLVLVEYILLQVGRITDPASSLGRPNLSIAHLNELLSSEVKLTSEIMEATTDIQKYRELIVGSRNRVIAHADRETMLSDVPLGDHREEDVTKFLGDLQRYLDAVGIEVGEEPLDISVTSCKGDVYDLLSVLRRGVTGLA